MTLRAPFRGLGRTLVMGLLMLLPTIALPAAEIRGYAFVQEDGSLRVDGRTVRLYGVFIPPSGQSCRTFERPVTCNSRAALALEFKIGTEFVHCDPRTQYDDGSVSAMCYARDVDLGAYMLENGWAMALPDAPFEYAALEKIASRRGVGVWGFPVDRRR